MTIGSTIVLSHSLRYGFAVLLTATSLTACGLTGDSSGGSDLLDFGKKGDWESDLAVIAYTQGNFDEADEHVLEALHDNKKNAQALLVGALLSEKTNRPNRARQYYEEHFTRTRFMDELETILQRASKEVS